MIKNLLPAPLDYRFIDRASSRVMVLQGEVVSKLSAIMIDANGDVLPNDSATEFLHMESFDDWLFQVKIGDHEEWSESCAIRVGAQRVFVKNDDQEEPLQVVMYGSISGHGSMQLSVSCPFWIINKTEDELTTRPYLS